MPGEPIIPARFLVTAESRSRYGERLDRLSPFLMRSDPLADAVVASFAELPKGQGFRMLDTALSRGIDAVSDAPDALRALFAALDHVPFWADKAAQDRGGATFLRMGALGGTVLGAKSLVMAYASPGGNKPLVFSGRLKEQARRRLGETGRFVYAVSQPGGMRRFSEGFAITVKVRIMHAQVRRLILASGRWRSDLWGEPINQHDMTATLVLFSYVVIEAAGRLGYRFPRADAEDLVQLWRYVGHVIGVDPEIVPTSLAEAQILAEMIHATQGAPDDDSRALVKALLTYRLREAKDARERRQAEAIIPIGYSLCHAVLDEGIAEQLAIPRPALFYGVPLLRAIIAGIGRASALTQVRDLAASLSDMYWQQSLDYGLGDRPADFKPPERFPTAEV